MNLSTPTHDIARLTSQPDPLAAGGIPTSGATVRPPLISAVLNAVASLNLPRAGLHSAFRNPEGLSILTLLSVLTYSYAVGCLASDEIEEGCRLDPALAYLSGGRLPSSPTIRRFRRVYRSQVAQTLYFTLAAAGPGMAPTPSHPQCTDLLAEVRRRIESAILADTIALDV